MKNERESKAEEGTFIWCNSIENELSKRRAGRKTANRRSGSISAPENTDMSDDSTVSVNAS